MPNTHTENIISAKVSVNLNYGKLLKFFLNMQTLNISILCICSRIASLPCLPDKILCIKSLLLNKSISSKDIVYQVSGMQIIGSSKTI